MDSSGLRKVFLKLLIVAKARIDDGFCYIGWDLLGIRGINFVEILVELKKKNLESKYCPKQLQNSPKFACQIESKNRTCYTEKRISLELCFNSLTSKI